MNTRQLMRLAYEHAAESHDPSTQNAALLISPTGDVMLADINRFPHNVSEEADRWERPLKYKFIEHAERNVIYFAAKLGIKTHGLTMICPWAPCTDCARAIVQSGIKKLITHKQAHDRSPDYWRGDIEIALTILKEAGVKVVMWSGIVGGCKIRHTGSLWTP